MEVTKVGMTQATMLPDSKSSRLPPALIAPLDQVRTRSSVTFLFGHIWHGASVVEWLRLPGQEQAPPSLQWEVYYGLSRLLTVTFATKPAPMVRIVDDRAQNATSNDLSYVMLQATHQIFSELTEFWGERCNSMTLLSCDLIAPWLW